MLGLLRGEDISDEDLAMTNEKYAELEKEISDHTIALDDAFQEQLSKLAEDITVPAPAEEGSDGSPPLGSIERALDLARVRTHPLCSLSLPVPRTLHIYSC